MEDSTLKDEIKKLNDRLGEIEVSDKGKPFKPKKKITKSDAKKNVVMAVIVGENKEFKFEKLAIEDGTVTYNKIPRLATAEYLGTYQGKPAMILPEGSTRPISFHQVYEEDAKDKMLAAGYRLLINRIELGAIKAKKKIQGWLIFVGILVVIVLGYLLLK